MGIRQFKPVTPATRFRSVSDFEEITKTTPEKSLLEPKRGTGGRNNKGHITSRYRGGGHKRQYRRIDFRREKFGVPAKVAAIEYDPNRTARIALLFYADGEKRYILAPKGLAVGDAVVSGPGSDIRVGNTMPLFEIPLGTTVHSVELKIGRGGQLARSAGTGVQVVAKEGNYVTLRLRSTEMRMVRGECLATVGDVDRARGAARPLGRHRGAGRGQGRELRHPATPLDGNAHGARRVPRHGRRGLERRARAAVDRQGGQESLARAEAPGARCGDEPGRPPAGRWRGEDVRWPAADEPLGQGRGPEDAAQEEAVNETHRSGTETREGNAMIADWRLRIADWTGVLRIRNPKSAIRN